MHIFLIFHYFRYPEEIRDGRFPNETEAIKSLVISKKADYETSRLRGF